MGLLSGKKNDQFDPDKEKCVLDEESMEFMCEFGDEKDGQVRKGGIVVNVNEDGEIVGSEHELEGFNQQEKERLKQITGSQLKQEIDSGPLSGYSNGRSL